MCWTLQYCAQSGSHLPCVQSFRSLEMTFTATNPLLRALHNTDLWPDASLTQAHLQAVFNQPLKNLIWEGWLDLQPPEQFVYQWSHWTGERKARSIRCPFTGKCISLDELEDAAPRYYIPHLESLPRVFGCGPLTLYAGCLLYTSDAADE